MLGRSEGGDEFVVGVQDFSVGVVWQEVGDSGEVVFVGVGDEFVVAVFQHFGREAFGERDGVGSEVDINGIGAPMAEEFDDVFVDFGAKESRSASRSEGTSGDFSGWYASEGLALGCGEAEGSGEIGGGERAKLRFVSASVFVVVEERRFVGAVVGDDFVGDAFEGANGADGLVGDFVGDRFTFRAILLVVEPKTTEVDGRVITRGRCGVNDTDVMFVKEVDVFEAEGFGTGVFAGGFGVLTGPEHEEVAHDTHVLDAAPFVWGEWSGARHGTEFGDDDGVDGPNSVGRRICSGKGLEHFAEAVVH